MTKEERLQFADLLDDYVCELEEKEKDICECKTKEEYAAQLMIKRHIKVINEIKVKNIIIGKQYEESENYKRFVKIVKEKNIKVKTVEAGQKINIERDLYFNVLWPNRQ